MRESLKGLYQLSKNNFTYKVYEEKGIDSYERQGNNEGQWKKEIDKELPTMYSEL